MKSVLLSYLGRKYKIVSITATEQIRREWLDKLKEQFYTVFTDDLAASVSAAVTFQKYHAEWDEYIKLERWYRGTHA